MCPGALPGLPSVVAAVLLGRITAGGPLRQARSAGRGPSPEQLARSGSSTVGRGAGDDAARGRGFRADARGSGVDAQPSITRAAQQRFPRRSPFGSSAPAYGRMGAPAGRLSSPRVTTVRPLRGDCPACGRTVRRTTERHVEEPSRRGRRGPGARCPGPVRIFSTRCQPGRFFNEWLSRQRPRYAAMTASRAAVGQPRTTATTEAEHGGSAAVDSRRRAGGGKSRGLGRVGRGRNPGRGPLGRRYRRPCPPRPRTVRRAPGRAMVYHRPKTSEELPESPPSFSNLRSTIIAMSYPSTRGRWQRGTTRTGAPNRP